MKKSILIAFIISLVLIGCGGGGGSSSSTVTKQTISQGQTVSINSGDTIKKNSDNTVVQITHTLDTNVKQLEVISGSVTLISGNYQAN